jgi:hypothetical protein
LPVDAISTPKLARHF